MTEGEYYNLVIYQNSLFPNQGCQLFIPGAFDDFYTIRITSAGQDDDGYAIGVQPQLFPLQIVKLWGRDTSEGFVSYAMW